MKQWTIAVAVALAFTSCNKGNKIYSGPSDKNQSSLSNKISVAEMFTVTRDVYTGACAKDCNDKLLDFAIATNIDETLNQCNSLFKPVSRRF